MKFIQLFTILALLGLALATTDTTQANVNFKLGTWAAGTTIAGGETILVGSCSSDLVISMESEDGSNDSPEVYALAIVQSTAATGGTTAAVSAESSTVNLGTVASLDKTYTLAAAEVAKFDISNKPYLQITWSDGAANNADTLKSGVTNPISLQMLPCPNHKIQIGASGSSPQDISGSTPAVQAGACNSSGVTFSVAAIARRMMATSLVWNVKSAASSGAAGAALTPAITSSAQTTVDYTVTQANLEAVVAVNGWMEISVTGDVGSTTGIVIDKQWVAVEACPNHKIQIGASGSSPADIDQNTQVFAGSCNSSGTTFSVAAISRRMMATSLVWNIKQAASRNAAGTALTPAITSSAQTTVDYTVTQANLEAVVAANPWMEITVTGDVGSTTGIVISKQWVQVLACPTYKIQLGASASSPVDITDNTAPILAGSCNSTGVTFSVVALSSRRELATSLAWTFMYASSKNGATQAYTSSVNTTGQTTVDQALSQANLTAMQAQGSWVKVSVSGDVGSTTGIVATPVWLQINQCPTHTIRLGGNAVSATQEISAGSCATDQVFTIQAITSRRELNTYAWAVTAVTDMTGNTAGTMPTAAQTALSSVTTNTDTLTIPASLVTQFRGSSDAYVKVALTYGSNVIEPVVVKVVACPAATTTTTNSQVLAFFSAVLAIIALLI